MPGMRQSKLLIEGPLKKLSRLTDLGQKTIQIKWAKNTETVPTCHERLR